MPKSYLSGAAKRSACKECALYMFSFQELM